MKRSLRQVWTDTLGKVSSDKLDLSNPKNAFIVVTITAQYRQGPLIKAFANQMEAEEYALQSQTGNTNVYLMSANPQHGLQQVANKRLVFVQEEVTEAA